ncbi:hypothetical protein WICPIJ_001081 [Wickerhamomyces pijperi]|uniref:Uncharacterized protein n=1 Tax=Wickerhamomyces pijperi TaxID=599730 RepID=A0A9P8QEG7_WICPI|nr:hypothetical protein WICPIJ_001081 [Wickerhamomyces pijperi]
MQYKPLPLIKPINPAKSKHDTTTKTTRTRTFPPHLTNFQKGFTLLISIWSIFVISILLNFDIITIPNCLWWCDGDTDSVMDDFPLDNYYSYAILLVPVMAWIWVVISWTGLKLFKHARGGKIKDTTGSTTSTTTES